MASALLAPKPKTKPATLNEFDVPTATEDRPKPLWVGTVRHKSPNCIWYGDFSTKAIKKPGSLYFNKVTVGYKYFLGIQVCLGWGQNSSVRRILLNDKEAWTGSAATGTVTIDKPELFGGEEAGGANGGFQGKAVFYDGNGTQVADPYVLAKTGAVPSYKDDAYIVFKGITSGGAYVGNSANFPDIAVEVSRYPNTLGVGSSKHIIDTYDANPVCALYEFMTRSETEFGGGFAEAQFNLTNWRDVAETIYDEGLGVSRMFDTSDEVGNIVTDYLNLIDGVINVNMQTGKLELVLARADYDPDDLIEIGEDDVVEVNYTRGSWADTFNEVKLSYIDRTQEFESIPVAAQDLANASGQLEVRQTTVQIEGVSNPTVANKIVYKELRTVSIPLGRLEIKINRKNYSLYGGAVFKWVGTRYGIAGMIFRVGEINDGKLNDGVMTLKCVQDVFSIGDTAFSAPEPTEWVDITTNAENITDERIIEQPYFFHETDNSRVMTVAAPADGSQISYDLHTKLSTETVYIERLTEVGFTPLGTLESDYSSDVYVTDGSLVVAPVSGMEDLPAAVTPGEIVTGRGFILINDELLAYESYTVDIDGNYVFDNVWGGLLDTLLSDHSEDDQVWFISEGLGLDETNYTPDTSVNARLLSNSPTEQIALGSATTITL